MTNREFFVKRWNIEEAAFVRVIRALPSDKLDYRPHEKSMPAGDLAWQITEEVRSLAETTPAGEIGFEMTPRPASTGAIVAAFEANAGRLQKALGEIDEARWEGPLNFVMGGKVLSTAPLGEMFWGFFFDLIHHRGQLSTYIRPMGGKVPSIYGPSGDDPGA